jgi:hypothetical protein
MLFALHLSWALERFEKPNSAATKLTTGATGRVRNHRMGQTEPEFCSNEQRVCAADTTELGPTNFLRIEQFCERVTYWTAVSIRVHSNPDLRATGDFASPQAYSRRRTHLMRDARLGRGQMASCAAASLHMMGMLLLAPTPSLAQQGHNAAAAASLCPGDNGGITLPPGFCATVFADHIGHARQMAFGPNGALYVNTWSGTYFRNDTPPPGGFLLALQDTNGDGRGNRDRGLQWEALC